MHWLRARALLQRWKEEFILVGYEMGWTVNFYLHQSQIWTNRKAYADSMGDCGAAAYAARKISTYQLVASTLDARFNAVNPGYSKRSI